MKCLVTGSAGFIGYHLCKKLLGEGHEVLGVDNLNSYYSVALKQHRINELKKHAKFSFLFKDFANLEKKEMKDVEVVFHEAAYAGVRDSIVDPVLYDTVNVNSTVKLLRLCVDTNVKKFLFASSSSVYGDAKDFPTTEKTPTGPKNPYGVSKLAGEFYCNAFNNCYGLPIICFRYFTMYGPVGRPDMCIGMAIKSCMEQRPHFTVFIENGKPVPFTRDFCYVDNAVQANLLGMESNIKFDIFNVASGMEVPLKRVLELVELETQRRLVYNEAPPSPADPLRSLGDISKIKQKLGFVPTVGIEDGIKRAVSWHKIFYS